MSRKRVDPVDRATTSPGAVHEADVSGMDDRDAIGALVSDLRWQIDQLIARGIKDNAGNPYNPSHYKRGLKSAIAQGGLAVAEYVRGYVNKPASGTHKRLAEAGALDLACEALVADETKPYAHLFTETDRAAARARLAPQLKAIQDRQDASQARIDARRSELPGGLDELRRHAALAEGPEDAIAINTAILAQAPDDPVALNRLGRAYEAIGSIEQAMATFQAAVARDPDNQIARRRLRDLERRGVSRR